MRLAAAPITPLTLVDHVHQRIWGWINSGKLEAGDLAAHPVLSEHMRLAKENALVGYFGPAPKSRPTPPREHPGEVRRVGSRRRTAALRGAGLEVGEKH